MGTERICYRCGKPAKGRALCSDERGTLSLCHGDDDYPTCYMLDSWERSAAWGNKYLLSEPDFG